MGKRTPLYELHVDAGAKIVDFGGWDMPLHYGSQIEEHRQVRNAAGAFDVSHMTVVELTGEQVKAFLQALFANDVGKLKQPGKAIYTCMLNESGGVIDDLIVYYLAEDWYRVVFNAATRDKDLAWVQKHAQTYGVTLRERDDLAMIAVQGPQARDSVHRAVSAEVADAAKALKPFCAAQVDDIFVARTGYTGEDGYELMLPVSASAELWRVLMDGDVKPIGLGARDTLRLEAGMNLYGTDMDEATTPLESGLAWTVAWEPHERAFIGRVPLEVQRERKEHKKFVGLVLEERGVLRNHQKVFSDDQVVGEITSGSFSPTLGKSIAFARVARHVGEQCQVDIRGKRMTVNIVKPPFVRNGKSCLN